MCLLVSATAVAQELPAAGEQPAAGERSVAELIGALGAPDWKERARAHEDLLARGESVRAEVSAALTSDDAEVALRASQILEGLARGQERATLQEFRRQRTPQSFEDMLLLVAKAVDPAADVDAARKTLAEWGETLRGRIGEETRPDRTLRRVVDYAFSVQGRSALFQRAPADVILTGALDSEQVEPLTLAILIKAVARRAGVELAVAQCPERVLLVDTRDPDAPMWVDLMQHGAMLERAEMKKVLLTLPRVYEDEMLEPETDGETLRRHVELLVQRCTWFGDVDTIPRLYELLGELPPRAAPGGNVPAGGGKVRQVR